MSRKILIYVLYNWQLFSLLPFHSLWRDRDPHAKPHALALHRSSPWTRPQFVQPFSHSIVKLVKLFVLLPLRWIKMNNSRVTDRLKRYATETSVATVPLLVSCVRFCLIIISTVRQRGKVHIHPKECQFKLRLLLLMQSITVNLRYVSK